MQKNKEIDLISINEEKVVDEEVKQIIQQRVKREQVRKGLSLVLKDSYIILVIVIIDHEIIVRIITSWIALTVFLIREVLKSYEEDYERMSIIVPPISQVDYIPLIKRGRSQNVQH